MTTWLYPANPKYYDVLGAFRKERTPIWPISSNVEKGDIVNIYVGAPYKQIICKCKVISIDSDGDDILAQDNRYLKVEMKEIDKQFMRLNVVQNYPIIEDGPTSFLVLKENGLKGSIMGPQKLENNLQLKEYLGKL